MREGQGDPRIEETVNEPNSRLEGTTEESLLGEWESDLS